MWVLESRLYTILKRGIPQCYELPSITTFPMVLYPIFDCFLKWVMDSCRFMKSTRLESFQRDRGIYGKRVRFTSKASIGNIGVFSLIETGKEQYMVRKANFKMVSECNWKNTLKFFNLPNIHVWRNEDKHWQRTCHAIQWGSSFP